MNINEQHVLNPEKVDIATIDLIEGGSNDTETDSKIDVEEFKEDVLVYDSGQLGGLLRNCGKKKPPGELIIIHIMRN